MNNDNWARAVVKDIEEFTKLAAGLAAGVEDGTIVLTEEEKQGLRLALQIFEIQAERLRLAFSSPGGTAHERPRQLSQGLRALS